MISGEREPMRAVLESALAVAVADRAQDPIHIERAVRRLRSAVDVYAASASEAAERRRLQRVSYDYAAFSDLATLASVWSVWGREELERAFRLLDRATAGEPLEVVQSVFRRSCPSLVGVRALLGAIRRCVQTETAQAYAARAQEWLAANPTEPDAIATIVWLLRECLRAELEARESAFSR